jgi:hypothetical protein
VNPLLFLIVVILASSIAPSSPAAAATVDLGNGFRDHGVVTPISNHRGTVATVDGEGRNVVLAWLMDHRGGYALLMVDVETGEAEQFPLPMSGQTVDAPYASILSSGNRFYTHFNSHFIEFDPAARKITFTGKTTPQMAMGMTEDDNGLIWAVTYPQSGVVSFEPKTRELRDYGHVYTQNWPQYQRFVAADNAGWIYFGLGATASQIVAFDPSAEKATPILDEEQRGKGTAYIYRDLDGKVYGQSLRGADGQWYELHRGEARPIDKPQSPRSKPIITESQALFHRTFPDGTTILDFNLVDRRLVIERPRTKERHEVAFDYESDGAHAMGVALAPDGTICGGTAFPMRFFSYDPAADTLTNRPAYGQWNTVARHRDRFFVGGYPGGFLLEWDPSQPWVNTDKKNANSNPRYLTEAQPAVYRPHRLLPLIDGNTVVMGGTPAYGHTGGGLLFWNRENGSHEIRTDAQLVADQSTISLIELADGQLLGGTTTGPGTGGEKKATVAELYLLDPASRSITWRQPLLPGVQIYNDLHLAGESRIYGVADARTFFVLDLETRAIVHQQPIDPSFGPAAHAQGPRLFIPVPDGPMLLLCTGAIVEVVPQSYDLKLLAKPPVPITAGGDIRDGVVYFLSGSHLASYTLPGK